MTLKLKSAHKAILALGVFYTLIFEVTFIRCCRYSESCDLILECGCVTVLIAS